MTAAFGVGMTCKCPRGVPGEWAGTVNETGWHMSCRKCRHSWTVPNPPPDPRDAELAALRAEVERLKVERDAALAEGAVIGRMNAMKDAAAEIGRLREALKPFAAIDLSSLGAKDKYAVVRVDPWDTEDFTGAHIEAARAALEPKP